MSHLLTGHRETWLGRLVGTNTYLCWNFVQCLRFRGLCQDCCFRWLQSGVAWSTPQAQGLLGKGKTDEPKKLHQRKAFLWGRLAGFLRSGRSPMNSSGEFSCSLISCLSNKEFLEINASQAVMKPSGLANQPSKCKLSAQLWYAVLANCARDVKGAYLQHRRVASA